MGKYISDKYAEWERKCDERFRRLKQNEEKINELFINIYGMEDDLSPDIKDEDVSLRKADLERDIKSLISYAVGCIMGRYSLKEEGLIFAGGTWEENRYSSDFLPCEFGVLPITEEQFFEEDLCTRVIDFIKVVYGEDIVINCDSKSKDMSDRTYKEKFTFKNKKYGSDEKYYLVIKNYDDSYAEEERIPFIIDILFSNKFNF